VSTARDRSRRHSAALAQVDVEPEAGPAPEATPILISGRRPAAQPLDEPSAGPRDATATIRRVVGGIMALLSTQPITWAATLLMTVSLPRYLDARAYGELGIALATGTIVGTVVNLGMSTVLTRSVASREHGVSALVTTSLVMVLGLGVGVSALTATLGLWSGLLVVSPSLLQLALLGMIVTQAQALIFAILAGQQRLGLFAWSNAALSLFTALLTVAVLMLGGGGVGTLAVSLSVTSVTAIVLWRRLGVPLDLRGVRWPGIVDLARSGLPFVAWDLLLHLRGNLDSIVLGRLLSLEAVGWWNAAQRIAAIPVFVPVLVVTPLLPALSGLTRDRETMTRTLRRAFELTVIVTTGISAGIAAVAPLVPSTLGWSEDYVVAVPVMQLLSPLLVLVSISMVLGTALIALGQERRWLLVNAVATTLQYVVLFTVIPATEAYYGNGMIGAAAGRIGAELVMVAGALLLLPRGMIGWSAAFFMARVALAGVFAGALALAILNVSVFMAAPVGIILYPSCLILLRVVRPSDLVTGIQVTTEALRRRTRRHATDATPSTTDDLAEESDGSIVRP
jgi:O-antigen/teichoic acid export membrane protein